MGHAARRGGSIGIAGFVGENVRPTGSGRRERSVGRATRRLAEFRRLGGPPTWAGETNRLGRLPERTGPGAYTFTVDSGEQIAIQLDGEAVEPGKAIELAAGLHPVIVEFRLKGGQPKLIVSWQPPDKTQPEVIPSDRLICPDWPQVLTWEMAQKPQQAGAIAVRLGLMVDRIDQPLAAELLALVKPDSPSALPAAEVLARVLSAGHLDDTFEKTLPEHLWPLVEKTDGQRQRVLVGALIEALGTAVRQQRPGVRQGGEG